MYLVLLQVVLPLLSLSRSSFVLGMLLLLQTSSLYKGRGALRKSIISLLIMVVVAVGFGMLRQSDLQAGSSVHTNKVMNQIYGEFSTVVAYHDIKNNIDTLGYQHGKTILGPVIFKVVPRHWLPNKPLNSSGYMMQQLFPSEFSAGFSLAPSMFGDLYLNFGPWGTRGVIFVLGVYACRLDRLYINRTKHKQPLLIWLFAQVFVYGFLRNNLADTISTVLLTLFVYIILKKIVLRNRAENRLPRTKWVRQGSIKRCV